MDYLESISDPLKYYFKEKIGSLYINKDVMRLFIEKGRQAGKNFDSLTNDSKITISEIVDTENGNPKKLNKNLTRKPSINKKQRKMARDTIAKYDSRKAKHQINGGIQLRSPINPHSDSAFTKLNSKFDQFNTNNNIVKEHLNMQTSTINSKLFARKYRSITKGTIIRAITHIFDTSLYIS